MLLPALLVLTVVPLPAMAQAQADDPLRTPACTRALQALQAAEADAAAAAHATAASAEARATPGRRQAPGQALPAGLQAARRQAAQACLGSRLDAPPPVGRLAQPPISVPPVVGNTAIPLPQRAAPGVPQALPRVPNAPLNSITSCDATGCWSSDGTRLQRQGGGQLLGPRGYCTVAGAVVTCP